MKRAAEVAADGEVVVTQPPQQRPRLLQDTAMPTAAEQQTAADDAPAHMQPADPGAPADAAAAGLTVGQAGQASKQQVAAMLRFWAVACCPGVDPDCVRIADLLRSGSGPLTQLLALQAAAGLLPASTAVEWLQSVRTWLQSEQALLAGAGADADQVLAQLSACVKDLSARAQAPAQAHCDTPPAGSATAAAGVAAAPPAAPAQQPLGQQAAAAAPAQAAGLTVGQAKSLNVSKCNNFRSAPNIWAAVCCPGQRVDSVHIASLLTHSSRFTDHLLQQVAAGAVKVNTVRNYLWPVRTWLQQQPQLLAGVDGGGQCPLEQLSGAINVLNTAHKAQAQQAAAAAAAAAAIGQPGARSPVISNAMPSAVDAGASRRSRSPAAAAPASGAACHPGASLMPAGSPLEQHSTAQQGGAAAAAAGQPGTATPAAAAAAPAAELQPAGSAGGARRRPSRAAAQRFSSFMAAVTMSQLDEHMQQQDEHMLQQEGKADGHPGSHTARTALEQQTGQGAADAPAGTQPAGSHATSAAAGAEQAPRPDVTFAELQQALPPSCSQGLHVLRTIARQPDVCPPGADPATVHVMVLLELWADPDALQECREDLSTDEPEVLAAKLGALQGMVEMLAQPLLRQVLGQQRQQQLLQNTASLAEACRQLLHGGPSHSGQQADLGATAAGPLLPAAAEPTTGSGVAEPGSNHQLLPTASAAPEAAAAAPGTPGQESSDRQQAASVSATFAKLQQALPQNAAIDILWEIAQEVHGSDADPAAVQVAPFLALWADPSTHQECRDSFSSGWQEECAATLGLLLGLLQLLDQAAVKEALGQQQHQQLSEDMAQLLQEFSQQVPHTTHTSVAASKTFAPQPAAAAVAAGQACIGCNTMAAGRPMERCPECNLWSCRAPCSASANPAAAGGRSRRKGAGLRWSCPNPECTAEEAQHTGVQSPPAASASNSDQTMHSPQQEQQQQQQTPAAQLAAAFPGSAVAEHTAASAAAVAGLDSCTQGGGAAFTDALPAPLAAAAAAAGSSTPQVCETVGDVCRSYEAAGHSRHSLSVMRQWAHRVLGTATHTFSVAQRAAAARLVDQFPMSDLLPHFGVFHSYISQQVTTGKLAAVSGRLYATQLQRVLTMYRQQLEPVAGVDYRQLLQQVQALHDECVPLASSGY